MVLFECHCSSHVSKQSVFNQLSAMPTSRSGKRRRSRTKRTFSDMKYPKVTTNMVGPSTTPNMTQEKQPIVSSDESDTKPEGVYQPTHIQTGAIAPVDNSALIRGIKVSEAHSAIAESQDSNSFIEKEAFTYMTGLLKKSPGALNSKSRSRGSNSI